jgi:glycosyltransferase involved in cell wall biosynthesis
MPALSIITINFNNAQGLQRTMESVINQTFSDYEYIIIDGGSTDGSVEMIKKYENKVRYWVSEKDNGVYDAQNKGLEKAQGEYIQVLNSGDELASHTILEDVFLNKVYTDDILYGNMHIQNKNIQKKGYMPSRITKSHMIKDTLWHPVSFVKRSFIKKVGLYNVQYKITADYDWFLRALFLHNASTYYINKFIVIFYEDGLSSSPDNTKQIIQERRKAQKTVLGGELFFIKTRNYLGASVIRLLKKVFKSFFSDKNLPYPHVYTPSGIPRDKIENTKEKVKLLIDPSPRYFLIRRIIDRYLYDKIVVLHGCEPPEINDIKSEMIRYGHKFTKVYSFDPDVLKAVQGSELFCFGSCWISDETNYSRFTTNKKFKLSFIKSAKAQLEGHKFRDNVEKLLQSNYPFEVLFPRQRIGSKEILFTDSMFHITIENSRHENYFTEKIVDCFMSYTVPIYWGCPNIASYFDVRGIIIINSYEELQNVLKQLTPEDYTSRLAAINANFLIAKEKYAFFFQRVNRIIRSI